MYMNRKKRNLILAASILNLISVSIELILSIVFMFVEVNNDVLAYLSMFVSGSLIWSLISFAIGVTASIFLLYSIREKGKYFHSSRGLFIAGFIIVVIAGGFLPWLLLFITFFISDVVIINDKTEMKEEIKKTQQEQKQKEQDFAVKKQKIEDLKKLRDAGVLTEDEYKQKLFEIL